MRADSARRFTMALRDTLGQERADEALRDTDDLWRALRAAELAGKDGPAVLRAAARQRDLEGVRSVSAVLAQRVRDMTEKLPGRPRESWLSRVPQIGAADMQRYLTELAQEMDGRQTRLGQHVAEHPPLWATQALGDVPDDPAARPQWEDKAGKIAAYREQYGWDHPGRAIGPEPNTTSPEARAEWRNAQSVMDKFDGIDVRHLTDGQLALRRDAYARETSWAPKYVANELRLARLAEHDSKVQAAFYRQEAEAAAAKGDHVRAGLLQTTSESAAANVARATGKQRELGPIHETRTAWERLTEPTLRLAQASDEELHRRGVLGDEDKLHVRRARGHPVPRADRGAAGGRRPAAADAGAAGARASWPRSAWTGTATPIRMCRPAGRGRRARTRAAGPDRRAAVDCASPPKTPRSSTWASRGPPSPAATARRSCSRPSPRSSRPGRSLRPPTSATARPTLRPGNDECQHPGAHSAYDRPEGPTCTPRSASKPVCGSATAAGRRITTSGLAGRPLPRLMPGALPRGRAPGSVAAGWDDRSVWGFDPQLDAYFAQLWRNPGADQRDDPDIWILGRGTAEGRPYAVESARVLAHEIAVATGADLDAVCRAMLGTDPES